MGRTKRIPAGRLLVLGLLTVACGGVDTPPNVLLVTLDTTRADRLGCYGHAPAGTATLDALAAAGARFERAYSQTPLTLASHTTMLTGLYAREHGLHVNGGGRLASSVPTLAERLGARGYRTGAFVSSFVLDGVFGLARGFDVYDDTMGRTDASSGFESERPADRVTDAALAWLERTDDRPFFAWVHYYDPHSGYAPPEDYRNRFDDPYDGEIAFVDDQLARIVAWLDATGVRDDTLIVVAGDHGEAFGEHDEKDHGLFVYETTLRVPLILTWPARIEPGTTPEAAASLVDLYPTVLELALADADRESSGRSLVPLLDEAGEAGAAGGGAPTRPVYSESRLGQIGYGWAPLRTLIDDGWKYIDAPTPELYDLRADADESINRAADQPERARDMLRGLRVFERAHEPHAADSVDLDSEAMAQLRSLGYVGGTDARHVDLDAAVTGLRDPKHMLPVYRGHLHAIQLIGKRDYAGAAALLEDLLAKSPESLDLYENLGFAYLALGRADEAERAYRESLTRIPEHAERLWGLGEALRRQNRQDEAIAAFEAALEHRPTLGEAHMALGQIYVARGDREQALLHARRHVDINPGSVVALQNLAEIAFMAEDIDLALGTVERWIAAAPRDPAAHNARWRTLHDANRRDEAMAALRDSLVVFPDDWNMVSTLAWLLATTPDLPASSAAEAVTLGERARALNDANPRSYDVLAAAYAAVGDFDAAIAIAETGMAHASAAGATRAHRAIEARLALYRTNQPYKR